MESPRLSIRISSELEAAIRQLSRKSGLKPSDVVRQVLEKHFGTSDSQPSCYDLAKEAKLIGCIKLAPHDLSTNPDHFEGFGK